MKGKRLIIIQGATGSGKSALAEELVQQLNGEIISADSRQVYRYLDIGTAKPDKAAQAETAYHLIDIVDPNREYNAGLFARDASAAIEEIFQREKVPFIVGGTGFYISALIKGLSAVPAIFPEARERVRQFLENNTIPDIFARVKEIDPVSASRLEPNDLHRQQRALEVYESTGKPLSWWWAQGSKPLDYAYLNIILDIERDQLYSRINKRIDHMLYRGLISEIRSLLKRGYKDSDPGMVSVGYREFYPWLRGEITFQEAVDKAKQHTRNYAKRQFTWYKKQKFDLTIDIKNLNLYLLKEKIDEYLNKGD